MIAVVFALDFEAAAFRRRSTHQPVHILGFMGKAGTDIFARTVLGTRPDLVLSAGFAGALQPGSRAGDLFIAENFTSPELLGRLSGPAFRIPRGLLHTADAVLATSARKRQVGEQTGATAVDMETRALFDLCRQASIPFVALRCISDTMEESMPVPADYLCHPRTSRPRPLALAAWLLAHPGRWPAFLRFLRDARTAQTSLAQGVETILAHLS